MQFVDAVTIAGTRRTRDGYLVADAKVGRAGIQIYTGAEVGEPTRDQVRVYRPPEEVFAKDAMASVAWRPVTVDHPSVMVDATNWRDLSVGSTGDTVTKDGDHIRVPLTLMDSAAIAAVEAGKRELSLGYTCDLDMTAGVTPSGETYDAVQRNIRVNHLAICSAARGGPDLRIGDQKGRKPGEPDVQLKTILVDGLTVETTDAGALAIDKLRGLLDTSAKALEKATTDHAAAIAAKDAELAAKDAEIDAAKAKIIDGAALDALVAERAAVTSKAKALDANVVIAGKSNIEIKRAVLGDKATGKPDAYVDAAFDLITVDGQAQGDALASFVSDAAGAEVKDAATKARDARAARLARLQNGYQAADQAA